MRILACDPGSSFGWASNGAGRLEWGTENFHIRNGESSGNRWRRFGEWLISASTMLVNDDEHDGSGLAAPYNPKKRVPSIDLLIYERAHFMPKARAAAEIAAGFTTRLEEHCERHGIALQPVPVSTLKAFARARSPKLDSLPKAGRQRAEINRGAREKLWQKAPQDHIDPIKELSDHEADACWLYWMGEAGA